MPELGFHAAQNVIDVSAVVALSLCILLKPNINKVTQYTLCDNTLKGQQ